MSTEPRAGEAALSAKSLFLSHMSHEVRTPMNAILGMASLLEATPMTSDQKQYVKIVISSGRTLLNLLNNLIDLADAETGQIVLDETDFDLVSNMEEMRDFLALNADAKNLFLKCHFDVGETRLVRGDPVRLRQILMNLIGNALKFTAQGGVTLTLSRESAEEGRQRFKFSVQDTGVGISPERRPSVFTSFSQTDPHLARTDSGSGIGLTIAKQIVEKMNGRIWFESELGVGTTFHVLVEFANAVNEPVLPVAQARPEELRDNRVLDVLLADDDESNRILIEAYLRDTGCRLVQTRSGAEALTRFEAGPFHIVLMDMRMPDMSGLTATRRLREIETRLGRARTPVIALTAHALREHVQASLEAGCDVHVTKPIARETLLAHIHEQTKDRAAPRAAKTAPGLKSGGTDAPPPAAREFSQSDAGDVPDYLRSRISRYIESRRQDLESIQHALAAGDLAAARDIGHNIKGTGSSYGFVKLTELGAEIERASESGETDAAWTALERLSTFVIYLSNRFNPAHNRAERREALDGAAS